MELDKSLVSEFAKITNDEKKEQPPISLLGTVVEYEGTKYVKLDGSDILTPIQDDDQISSTVEIQDSERVTVQIQNHAVTVTGNISSPAARIDTVNDLRVVLVAEDDKILAEVKRVEDETGSELEITHEAIASEVKRATGVESSIKQYAESINISVANGENEAYLYIWKGGVQIYGGLIDFSGKVSFTDLKNNSKTWINGDYIKSGTIDASKVALYGEDYDYNTGEWKGGGVKAGTGSDGKRDTYGAKLYGYGEYYHCLATDAGVCLHGNKDGKKVSLYCAGSAIVASTPISESSDRRKKNSISGDLSRYEQFFQKLQPVYFKFNEGNSNRFHIGFIAQDVEQALADSGLSNQDFAGVVIEEYKNEDGELVRDYLLRYTEFVSLNTYMIKKLSSRIDDLEKEIAELKTMVKGAST